MSEWVNWHTVIAFFLGVALAAWVKMLYSQVKGKVAG